MGGISVQVVHELNSIFRYFYESKHSTEIKRNLIVKIDDLLSDFLKF